MFRQNYQTCVSDRSLEFENGYNIKLNIQAKNGTLMKDLGFDCEFWVEGSGRKIVIGKADMGDITQIGKSTEYYAQLYSSETGNAKGWLFCTIAIQQPDKNWPSGYRDVTIEKVFTGIFLGQCCGRMPRAPRSVCHGNQWHEGFKVSFEKVDWLPNGIEDEEEKPEVDKETDIRYGVIRGLKSFSSLTNEDVAKLTRLTSKPSGVLSLSVNSGDTIVVLTKGETVYKDDGVGGKVPFSTSVMGANGELITIAGVSYFAYGEIFLVSGSVDLHFV